MPDFESGAFDHSATSPAWGTAYGLLLLLLMWRGVLNASPGPAAQRYIVEAALQAARAPTGFLKAEPPASQRPTAAATPTVFQDRSGFKARRADPAGAQTDACQGW